MSIFEQMVQEKNRKSSNIGSSVSSGLAQRDNSVPASFSGNGQQPSRPLSTTQRPLEHNRPVQRQPIRKTNEETVNRRVVDDFSTPEAAELLRKYTLKLQASINDKVKSNTEKMNPYMQEEDIDQVEHIFEEDLVTLFPEFTKEQRETLDKQYEKILTLLRQRSTTLILGVSKQVIDENKVYKEIKAIATKLEGMNERKIEYFVAKYKSTIYGYGILDALLSDDSVTDIKLVDYNNIRVKRIGRRQSVTGIQFKDRKEMNDFIEVTAQKLGAGLASSKALPRVSDSKFNPKYRLRISFAHADINSDGRFLMHIRKIPKIKPPTQELIRRGLMTREQHEYLVQRVLSSCSIFFAGQGGSGKTTVVNDLIEYIDPTKSILCVQEVNELFTSSHPEFTPLEVKETGGKVYDIRTEVESGLTMDIDYFIIGEIKSGEAFAAINAIHSGTACMGTLHAESEEGIPEGLAQYSKFHEAARDLKHEDIMRMLSCLDVLVFLKDYRIMSISEVVGFNENTKTIDTRKIFDTRMTARNGKVELETYRVSPSVPKIQEKFDYYLMKQINAMGGVS